MFEAAVCLAHFYENNYLHDLKSELSNLPTKLSLKQVAILHLNLPAYSALLNYVRFNDDHRIWAEKWKVHKEMEELLPTTNDRDYEC